MEVSDIIYSLLGLTAGIGIFLFGVQLMSDSLENIAGNKIKDMFSKINNNKLVGVGIGFGTTAVIQSSTAVTVMLVGFVNSGFMSLMQATTIIYGTNIGTTLTAQLVALGFLGGGNFDLSGVFGALAGVGAFITMFAKKEKLKKIGGVVTGIGMIFAGLTFMSDSMAGFAKAEGVVNLIGKLDNAFVLILFGAVFTAIIQSSTAVSGLVITSAAAGIIDFSQAMYIVVGSNVGTCLTAILSSVGTNANARRTGIIHLLFNIIGTVLFLLSDIFIDYPRMFGAISNNVPMQIALLNTYLNIAPTIIMLPFTGALVKLATLLVKDTPDAQDDSPHFYFIEQHLLRTPPIAVAQFRKEVINMASIAKTNFDLALDACVNVDTSQMETLQKNEKILNFLNREAINFLISLSHTDIPHKDKVMLGTSYHTVSDLERIGDYAENIMEYAVKMKEDGLSFSEEAISEINQMKAAIDMLYKTTLKIYSEVNLKYLSEANSYEEEVDKLKELMGKQHIVRLSDGTCSPGTGAIYLSLASNAERVADHMINIAYAVKSYAPKKRAPKPA